MNSPVWYHMRIIQNEFITPPPPNQSVRVDVGSAREMKRIHVELLGPEPVTVVDSRQGGFADVLILSQDGKTPAHALKLIRVADTSKQDLLSEVARLAALSPHRNVVEIQGCTPRWGQPVHFNIQSFLHSY